MSGAHRDDVELEGLFGGLVDLDRPVVSDAHVPGPAEPDPYALLTQGPRPSTRSRRARRSGTGSVLAAGAPQTSGDVLEDTAEPDLGADVDELDEVLATEVTQKRPARARGQHRPGMDELDFPDDVAALPPDGPTETTPAPPVDDDADDVDFAAPDKHDLAAARAQEREQRRTDRAARKGERKLRRQQAVRFAPQPDDSTPVQGVPDGGEQGEDLDLDALAAKAEKLESRSARTRPVLAGVIGAAVVLVLVLVLLVVVPLLTPKDEVLEAPDWFSTVSQVGGAPAGPLPGTTADPVWTAPGSGTVQTSVMSAGVLRLSGATLEVIDPADGATVLASTELTEPVDYTLEAVHEDRQVIAWLTGTSLQYWVEGESEVRQWPLPEGAGAVSPGGGILVQGADGSSWAAVPLRDDLVPIQAPAGMVVASSNDRFATAVSGSAPQARLIPMEGSDFPQLDVTLAAPFEEATLYGTVYAGNGKAAVLWTGGADPRTLTLSVHSLTDGGQVLSSVPVSAERASRTSWSMGQGGTHAVYGQYLFDVESGAPVAALEAQKVFEGAAGPYGMYQTDGRHHFTDGERIWDDTRKIAGVTHTGQLVMRAEDGSISGYDR